ncbi:MAG: hypothetical protein J1E79_07235, partial [Rikenella sp.]|nr:hypothetical protein [Rikenella sp.]
TSGRSGQPPPTGWLRHSTMLVSSRRAADPVPLTLEPSRLYQRPMPTEVVPSRLIGWSAQRHPFESQLKCSENRSTEKD